MALYPAITRQPLHGCINNPFCGHSIPVKVALTIMCCHTELLDLSPSPLIPGMSHVL